MKLNFHRSVLILVLLLASTLRLVDFSQWSLSNDELSSWNRTQYESAAELIEEGVKPDGHPALNQLFLYSWLKLVPDEPWLIRLPYVILSCIGLYLFYLFAKEFINRKAALLFLILLSFGQLFVIYHQIARPYSLGFFILSAFSYTWVCFLQRNHWKNALFYSISGALALYTHYFLGLTVLCIIILGFLLKLLKKEKGLLGYFNASVLIGLLFLPHLGITLEQFSQGGLNWLPPPEANFIWDFLEYGFNHSSLLLAYLVAAPVIAILLKDFQYKKIEIWVLPLLFLIPYTVIYQYSVNVKPVIQFSSLIFSFPYLLLFMVSFFTNEQANKGFKAHSIILLFLALGTLFLPKNILSAKPFANFEEVSTRLTYWKKQYGNELKIISNANDPAYLNYYHRRSGIDPDPNLEVVHSEDDLKKAFKEISKSDANYLALGFANVPLSPEVYELARFYYPRLIEHDRFFNSEVMLLGKGSGEEKRKSSFLTKADTSNKQWEINLSQLNDSNYYMPPYAFAIDSTHEYSLTYRSSIGKAFQNWPDWLSIRLQLKSESGANIKLVASIDRNGKNILWRSMDSKLFYHEGWYTAVLVFPLPAEAEEDDELLIYLWNSEKHQLLVDEFSIVNYEDANFDYYQLR